MVFNIVQRLDRRRFAPAVCVSKRGGALDAEVERLGIPLLAAAVTVTARPYRTVLPRAWRVAQPFRSYGFTLWHSFDYRDDYTEPIIARLAGAKAWLYTKKAMAWGSRAWLVRSYLATRIVADNSEMPAFMFDRAGLRRKVYVVPHGVATDEFSPPGPGR
ncbi:MAG: hypothetical protein ACREMO_10975 [Gemmatimonadales bacterium]